MKQIKVLLSLGIVATLVLALVPLTSASADIRITGNGANLPFYARIGGGSAVHNDTWAVIVFYRSPECIPAGFNLLEFYDIPGAFSCTNTVDGFVIWQNGPEVDPVPVQSRLFGLGAVPVWFVSWPVLENAMSDGVLTVGELKALDPLIGSASYFEETLHPSGGKHPSMIEFMTSGSLADGRTFAVNANSTDAKNYIGTKVVFK